MILERLKHETHAAHMRLEATVDLPGRLRSAETYRALLARFYSFYAPLEPRILARSEWAQHDFPIAQRAKVPALARDLAALGFTPEALAALPRCEELPALASFPAALGAMYVLEGATLGGQLISRAVRAELGFAPETGCAFFASYGRELGPMWQAFRALLARAEAENPASADAIVAGARATFAALGAWIAGAQDGEKF